MDLYPILLSFPAALGVSLIHATQTRSMLLGVLLLARLSAAVVSFFGWLTILPVHTGEQSDPAMAFAWGSQE